MEWGTLSDLHVNYDARLNAKTGDPGQFGQTEFRTPPGGASIRIFIILGPNALDPVGPQHTQMAFDHENEHAADFLIQFVSIGSTAHAATSGEELRIHTEGFSLHFLDLWTINNTTGAFSVSNDFGPIFTNYRRRRNHSGAARRRLRQHQDVLRCPLPGHPLQRDEVQDLAADDAERPPGRRCLDRQAQCILRDGAHQGHLARYAFQRGFGLQLR